MESSFIAYLSDISTSIYNLLVDKKHILVSVDISYKIIKYIHPNTDIYLEIDHNYLLNFKKIYLRDIHCEYIYDYDIETNELDSIEITMWNDIIFSNFNFYPQDSMIKCHTRNLITNETIDKTLENIQFDLTKYIF